MAKANLTLPDGTTVNIEGTAEEVALLLARFSQQESVQQSGTTAKKKKKKKKAGGSSNKTTVKRKGPQQLIEELVKEGFFKSKRQISAIQKKLEEGGHIYAIETLSTPLVRLTRRKVLRRLKENKHWVYVS